MLLGETAGQAQSILAKTPGDFVGDCFIGGAGLSWLANAAPASLLKTCRPAASQVGTELFSAIYRLVISAPGCHDWCNQRRRMRRSEGVNM
jgi:hypothetical protein